MSTWFIKAMLKIFSALNLMGTACTRQIPSIAWLISLALVVVRAVKRMSKRKVKLYLVNDCGGEWEEAWNEPVIAFANQEDATRCAVAREPRQSILMAGRDYSGSFVTQIDAVIDDSIFAHKDVRDE